MSIGNFETNEHEGRPRPWRCTISVPYVHKASAHTNERHTANAKEIIVRDKGVFFMGECQVDWSCYFGICAQFRATYAQ